MFTTPKGVTIEEIEKLLKEAGIDGSTYHFDNNQLAIIAFSEDEVENIVNKINEINKERKQKYEYKERNFQNSR